MLRMEGRIGIGIDPGRSDPGSDRIEGSAGSQGIWLPRWPLIGCMMLLSFISPLSMPLSFSSASLMFCFWYITFSKPYTCSPSISCISLASSCGPSGSPIIDLHHHLDLVWCHHYELVAALFSFFAWYMFFFLVLWLLNSSLFVLQLFLMQTEWEAL
ncbi:hypothetical protein Taro_056723 [Colocasia esculenta]|uniref:Uncharacterized protein n=1 Tax=Colocasia esculenta TaxID=4460 RepID=A0A843XY94_COLES|nr:hypothetical protein [Colocasia esculenta]